MKGVTDRLVQNNAQARGAEGLAWLARLPETIADLEDRWSIRVEEPFPRLSFNYVAPVIRDDWTRAVLKVGPSTDPEFMREGDALRCFDGRGIVRLLEWAPDQGAMLLERIEPGVPLHTLPSDEAATTVAASLMIGLRCAAPHDVSFATVGTWGEAFASYRTEYGDGGPLPRQLFELGESLYMALDASTAERFLLHGDLHHENILSAQREPWLIIDPQCVVGDPLFEVGPFLNNLWEDLYDVPYPERVLNRRVDQLAEALEADRERVRAWGIAFCVLSAVWSAENGGGDWGSAINHAALLSHGRVL